jgi:inosine-uridine nucleoside N-ribohydrolase
MSEFAARPVIIDCDPGHDDALALLLAAGDSGVRLLGVTTVAGNQTLDKTTKNARKILAVAGVAGVPVATGRDRPLVGDLTVAGGRRVDRDVHPGRDRCGSPSPHRSHPERASRGGTEVDDFRRLLIAAVRRMSANGG